MMRSFVGIGLLCAVTAFTACDDSSGQTDEFLESQAPKPKIDLKTPTSTLTHTSSQPWLLSKIGSVDTTASTVTWSINATQGPAGARRLVVSGNVTIRNTGGLAAPVGNLVLRLQSKLGSTWTTRSVDIANAAFGDAATAARVVTGNTATTMNENSASGAFSAPIAGGLSIPANSSVPLAFTAAFNNDVLGISSGTTVRAEIFVTWGNAGPGGTPTNVDIDGNGVVDMYETRVDGKSILLGDKVVPASSVVTTPVTLSDTVADITTTGTATFSNPVFTIGQTTGTVQVSYDGGLSGGTIRNCAHLTGTGINLETCSTQIVPREAWQTNDLITYSQEQWDTSASSFFLANYGTVYSPTFAVEVGIIGTATNQLSIRFTNSSAVLTYFPSIGPDPLVADSVDPNESEVAGSFGGDVVALQLDVDFADKVAMGTSGVRFGDLFLCNFGPALSDLNEMTVREYLANANVLLGGGIGVYTRDALAGTTDSLTIAFSAGAVSTFANDHLYADSCP